MIRRILDAGIVWWEGVPETKYEEIDTWRKLSSQTGETFSGIVKEFTGFKP